MRNVLLNKFHTSLQLAHAFFSVDMTNIGENDTPPVYETTKKNHRKGYKIQKFFFVLLNSCDKYRNEAKVMEPNVLFNTEYALMC